MMKYRVQFTTLEEDEKDLIVSFAIDDADLGVRSLILLRTPFYEGLLDDEERGVTVSLEGDHFEQEDHNMLKSITIRQGSISIESTYRKYDLDISTLSKRDYEKMVQLLKKQNYDNRFIIDQA